MVEHERTDCENYCPRCLADNITWRNERIENDLFKIDGKCRSCSAKFTEVYIPYYSGTIFEE